MPSIGFALDMISSAYHSVSLNISGLCSFQVFLPTLLVRQDPEPCLVLGGVMAQLPCLGSGNRQGSSTSVSSCLRTQIRQICTLPISLVRLNLVPQMIKASGLDYCLCSEGSNLVC